MVATKANGTAKAATEQTAQVLSIPVMSIKIIRLYITGDSSLITHAWSEKAIKMIRDKQTQAAKEARGPKNPQEEYESAFYRLPDGDAAFPTIAFKQAVVDAATQVSGVTKTYLRGCFHTVGDLVKIDGTPRMREDMVRVGMGSADLRYRPEFDAWGVVLTVRLNVSTLSIAQLVHLFNTAGFSVGVGEMRPQKDGAHGMFHVETVEEVG